MTRILAVDPGEARIGIALSDPSRTIAAPLSVLQHDSRAADAARIASLAHEHEAVMILVGVALDDEGRTGPQARKALRLVEALEAITDTPVETWDESGTSQLARSEGGSDEDLDARAAAYMLQDYLDHA